MHYVYLICCLAFCFIQCDVSPEPKSSTVSAVDSFFQGEHDLYSFSEDTNVKLYINGFKGDAVGDAQFIWKNNSDQYIMSCLPLDVVRIQIEDNDLKSYCKFRWTSNITWNESKWSLNVIYAVFVLRSDQIKFKDSE
jgi:hypothetical protein